MTNRMNKRRLVESCIRSLEKDDKVGALRTLHALLRSFLDPRSRPKNGARVFAKPRLRCPRCGRVVAQNLDGGPHAHHRFDNGEKCT